MGKVLCARPTEVNMRLMKDHIKKLEIKSKIISTETWDEMSRWAAGRYQLLVLSSHYQESSEQLVQYLENIETKISQAGEDIPEAIVEKIKSQSSKAKVKFYDRHDEFIFNMLT